LVELPSPPLVFDSPAQLQLQLQLQKQKNKMEKELLNPNPDPSLAEKALAWFSPFFLIFYALYCTLSE
jgi:hypothetical protein